MLKGKIINSHSRFGGFRFWATALLIVAFVALYICHSYVDLSYRRDLVDSGQWWRLFSGQFVHNNNSHLFSNMAALLLCRVLLSIVYGERDFILSLLSCAFMTGVLIHFLLPSYEYYLGVVVFAGVLVGVGEAALGLIRPAALPPK